VPEDAFRAGLEILRSRYRVVHDDRVLERTGYLAGDDDRRAEELGRYLADPDVRGIVCARGGYGITRILDRLDGDALRRDPKVVVGFSDATALLSFCVLDGQVRPVHGPVVTQLGRLPAADAAWLFRLLEDPEPLGALPFPLRRIGARGGGTVEGRLVGGNLELVSRLVGTPWELDLGAGILLLEEIGERPYRIDRSLTQLRLAGALDGVRAVAVGDLARCEEPDGTPPTAAEVVDERLAAFRLPGVAGLPVGHDDAGNRALPIGARCALDLAEARLILEEGAVS
jgi:muramoyltetrapeptide carboxypeptidase